MAGLRADSQGFLLGQRRIREGVQAVFADTQEILRILQGGDRAQGDCTPDPDTLADAIRRASTRRTRTINRPPEPIDVRVTVTVEGQATDVSGQAEGGQGQGNGRPARRQNRRRSRQRRTRTINRPPSDSPIDSDAGDAGAGAGANGRQRDARGRFTRDGSSGEADADSKRRKFVSSLAKAIGDRFDKSNSDLPDQVDPLIDAYKETKTLLAPVGKVVSLAGAVFKPRKKEESPPDQRESNDRQEKLLTKIWKLLRRPIGRSGEGAGSSGMIGRMLLPMAAMLVSIITGILGAATTVLAPLVGMFLTAVGGIISAAMPFILGALPAIAAAVALALGGKWIVDQVNKHENITRKIGEAIARTLAFFGNDEAQDAVNRQDAPQKTMDENRDNSHRYGTGDFRGVPYAAGSGGGGVESGNDRQLWAYDAARELGYSENQARFLNEQIGREGSFLDKNLFGVHIDPSNGARNMGAISWQKDRADKLLSRMKSKGFVLPNGNFVASKDSLKEQISFMTEEMRGMPNVNREFLSNPNVDQETARRVLGDNFIKWKRTNRRYGPRGNRNMDEYSKMLDAKIAQRGKNPLPTTAPLPTSSAVMDAAAENIKDQGKPKKFDRYGSALIPKPKLANLVAPTGATIDFNKALPLLPIPPEPAKPPKPPKVEMPVSSPKPQVVTLAPNGDTISQNVSDRLIAHAVTGGLGMDRWDG